jgi:hypothetical protein
MRKAAALSAAVLTGAVLTALPASPAHASASSGSVSGSAGLRLPVTSFYQLAVDSRHDHLFFSEGYPDESGSPEPGMGQGLLVTGFSGKTAATRDAGTEVTGLALSPDGTTLYAALPLADEVAAISTATLKQTAAYHLGPGDKPMSVAVASGKLWVSYDTGVTSRQTYGDGKATIGDFSLPAAHPALRKQAAMGGWYWAPLISADPTGKSHVLAAAQPYISSTEAATYNTAVTPATVVRSTSDLTISQGECENDRGLAVAPGGAQFVPACGNLEGLYRFSTGNLAEQGTYAGSFFPVAVAIAAKAGLVALGEQNDAPDIFVYKSGAAVPADAFETGFSVAPGGLGLTADGSRLFAVTVQALSAGYWLHEFSVPAHQAPALTLSGARVTAGQTVTLHGHLDTGKVTAFPAWDLVYVTRSGGHQVRWANPDASGNFTITDTPTIGGTYYYTASFAGYELSFPGDTAGNGAVPGWAVAAVSVAREKPALSATVTPRTASRRQVVRVTVHLGRTYTNRTVTVYARPTGSKQQTRLASGAVNSAGNLTVRWTATRAAVLSAAFAGDAQYQARTVTTTVTVQS